MEIHCVGGYGRFGRNTTIYRTDTTCLLVDAGLRFNNSDLGSFSSEALLDVSSKLLSPYSAIVITHAHEDHIGSLPYLLKTRKLPIFATKFAIELIRQRFTSMQIAIPEITEILPGTPQQIGDAVVDCFQMSHSIPDANALIIRMADKVIFHSGDFKFDFGSGMHRFSDIDGLQKIGYSGVDLLVCDSTNSTLSGFCPSEEIVTSTTGRILRGERRRTFIATFSSHVHRIGNLSKLSIALGYEPIVGSNTIASHIGSASRSGHFPDLVLCNQLLNSSEGRRPTKTDSVIFISGTQGESGSGLSRLGNGSHPRFSLAKTDRVIISARTIPGNESAVRVLVEQLKSSGCTLITSREEPGIHVSGHGFSADLELLGNVLKPKFYLPMHGDTRMQSAGIQIFQDRIVKRENCLVIAEGNGVALDSNGFSQLESAEAIVGTIDDSTKSILSNSDISDRRKSFFGGTVTGNACFDSRNGAWITPFFLIPIGLSWLSPDVLLSIEKSIHEQLDHEIFQNRVVDPEFLSRIAEDQLGRAFNKKFKARPAIRCKVIFYSES